MCGFSGVVLKSNVNQQESRDNLVKAVETIHHRGPDCQGFYTHKNVMLAHARLSILDLSDAGKQPMRSSCGRYVISYNGEVYNFEELATEFDIENRVSKSDTEVILKVFQKIGVNSFPKLNGMFAFAIYDTYGDTVWLVRDRIGIKPLFYKQTDRGIFFGSEIKVIHELDPVPSKINTKAVHEWSYYGNCLGKQTLYSSINKLLPGHILEVNTKTLSVKMHCYWSQETVLRAKKSDLTNSVEGIIAKTRKLLESAVTKQLVSDVPIGVFLSGGIDSSAVTAFASRNYSGKLATFSVGFDFDKMTSELPKAKNIASLYGTEHHEIHISGFDVADTVEKMVHHNDLPFSDAANIPLYLLCAKVNSTTKVILQGDGGDELFGGYQRYNTLSHIRLMRFVATLGGCINKLMPRNVGYYSRQRYINALKTSDPSELMALLLTVEDRTSPPTRIFAENFRGLVERSDPFSRYRHCASLFYDQDLVNQMLLVDNMIILPDIFLEKVDRATMAAGVEVRVPFLDNDLIDFCIGIPSKIKVQRGVQKWLLKKSLEGIVPNDVLYGKKQGFGVPFGFWIKGPLRDLLFDNLILFSKKHPKILDMKFIKNAFGDHLSGRRDYGFLLWKLMNFVLWVNTKNIQFR